MFPQDLKNLVREFVPPTPEAQMILANRGVLNEELVEAALHNRIATLYLDPFGSGCTKFCNMGFELQLRAFSPNEVVEYQGRYKDSIVATHHFSFTCTSRGGNFWGPKHRESLVKKHITFIDLLNFIKEVEQKMRWRPENHWFGDVDRSHIFLEMIEPDPEMPGSYVAYFGS